MQKGQGGLATRHFTVGSIPQLARSLTPIQHKVLNEMWTYHVSFGTSYSARAVAKILKTQSVDDAFSGLNGSLLYESTDHNDRVYRLTLHGALLTAAGPFLAANLAALFELVNDRYRHDSHVKEITNTQIAEGTALSIADLQSLCRLLVLGTPSGTPFYLSSWGENGDNWAITVTIT